MVLKWNSNIESVIHTIEKQSKLFKKIHIEVSTNEYWKYSMFMNIAIIISPLSGLVTVVGNILCKEIEDMIYYNSSAAILSFLTTVIVAIIKFNKLRLCNINLPIIITGSFIDIYYFAHITISI